MENGGLTNLVRQPANQKLNNSPEQAYEEVGKKSLKNNNLLEKKTRCSNYTYELKTKLCHKIFLILTFLRHFSETE